jgi:hypothetical protein
MRIVGDHRRFFSDPKGAIFCFFAASETDLVLKSLGFTGVTVEATKTYDPAQAEEFLD